MGDLDMSQARLGRDAAAEEAARPSSRARRSGEKQMEMLRRLPKILRFIPGKAQDLRAWFLSMQYWLGGSDDNIEQMLRFLVSRYAAGTDWRRATAKAPVDYPDVGLYHPALPAPDHHQPCRPAAPRRCEGDRRPADPARPMCWPMTGRITTP